MGRFKYCVPCATRGVEANAVVVIDGDPLCVHCAAREAARSRADAGVAELAPPAPRFHTGGVLGTGLCSRGCGMPTHRGGCRGVPGMPDRYSDPSVTRVDRAALPVPAGLNKALAAGATAVKTLGKEEERGRMDLLVSKEVGIDEIPAEVLFRAPLGRAGQMWSQLLELRPGRALKVENRDIAHASRTRAHMCQKARGTKWVVVSKRDGSTLYLYLKERPADSIAAD